MITELFLILKLLGDTVGDTPISPPPTTKLSQPVIIPDLTPQEVATAYLEDAIGKPENWETKIATGRL
tara:strand:+ start:747 stop:950 length:204 start_codon:yes stop_codon:yes gene_type:complete